MPEVVYGGPYMHESAAIEAELLAAHNENREPDLWGLFTDKIISAGAVELVKTHTEGKPKYEGERYYENIYAEGVPIVKKPSEDYVFPGEGGTNIVDKETED